MKIKSLKRLPYKFLVQIPFLRNLLLQLLNKSNYRIKAHLWEMLSTKPPLFFTKDKMIKTNTESGNYYISPLRKDYFKLDWCLLFSMGHDIEVKNYYTKILKIKKPRKFIDIGGNYGLHSAIFSSYGVPVVSVEPNPECVERIILLNQINNFKNKIIQKAMGDTKGSLCLIWPKGATWLGTVVNCNQNFNLSQDFETVQVEVSTIDQEGLIDSKDILIKIDVEGFEVNVLRGAINSIKKFSPVIIFESVDNNSRLDLYKFFESIDYCIESLDFQNSRKYNIAEDFQLSKGKNYIATKNLTN